MLAEKARRIELWKFNTPAMRAFHMTWMAFFCCFFSWFGIAPLMAVVRREFELTTDQVGWCIVASVAGTIFSRLLFGWLCDRYGARLSYACLLVLGSIPVMGVGLASSFETFIVARFLIGLIGASFVITQYHTSVMFAPNCVGTANATAAGWGNLGGGVTQFAMPLLFGFLATTLGFGEALGWRLAMFLAGIVCLLAGIAYYFFTQDLPGGNMSELRAAGLLPAPQKRASTFWEACRDVRVWMLFVAYGACFGVELTMDNVAHLYFHDNFGLSLQAAGFAAGAFGMMNLFARALGGYVADWFGLKWDLRGRVAWLFVALFCEGLALMLFSQTRRIELAIPAMLLAGLFVKMANGATYSVVPFINKRALGSVAGIVGAGGNAGAVLAGLLFKVETSRWSECLLILGFAVTAASFLVFFVRPARAAESEELPRQKPVEAEPLLGNAAVS